VLPLSTFEYGQILMIVALIKIQEFNVNDKPISLRGGIILNIYGGYEPVEILSLLI